MEDLKGTGKLHERKQVKPGGIVQILVKEAEVLNMLGVSGRLCLYFKEERKRCAFPFARHKIMAPRKNKCPNIWNSHLYSFILLKT